VFHIRGSLAIAITARVSRIEQIAPAHASRGGLMRTDLAPAGGAPD
jgi:hypothetical protein